MRARGISAAGAILGGLVFAAGGAAMGSMNAGWFDLERNANTLFPLLGAGVLLILASAAHRGGAPMLREAGGLGKAAGVLVAVAPVLFLVNPLIQFAIFGTLALGIGLALFAAVLWRGGLMRAVDRVLATICAVASLTWNTETLSAFLLVAVGLLLAVLVLRMGEPDSDDPQRPPATIITGSMAQMSLRRSASA